MTSGCWTGPSLLLSIGAGGRNKDGCEPSLGDPCREIRESAWGGRGRATSLGERVETEADGDTACLSSLEDHRGSTEASYHNEKAISHGKLQMSHITFHTSSPRTRRQRRRHESCKRAEIPPPSAFQDVGKAANLQREGSADKELKFQTTANAIHQWKILFRPLSAPFITPVVRVSLAISPFVVGETGTTGWNLLEFSVFWIIFPEREDVAETPRINHLNDRNQ